MVLQTTYKTWQEGYRPTMIRVTGDSASSGTCYLQDTAPATLASWTASDSAVTAEITWGERDLLKLVLGTNYDSITKVEFYEE